MKRILFIAICILSFTASCTDMDDNYKQYLEEIPTYSPTVTDVSAVSPEAGTLTLTWELPKIQLAESIEIVYKETNTVWDKVELDLVTTYTLTGLKLQGYTIEIYTIDKFGNRSIPVSKFYTPIPGREGGE